MGRMVTTAKWDISPIKHVGDIRYVGSTYLTSTNTKGITRKGHFGQEHQDQLWSTPQFPPQKVKFPHGLTSKKVGRASVDTTQGKWYFEEELIQTNLGNRLNFNAWQDGWYGGLILMTKYEAREMGLSVSDVKTNYNQDVLADKTAKRFGTKVRLFFNYRKDGSIESIYTPPPPPPPIIKYIEVPAPPPDKPVIEPTPEPVFEVSQPEPVIAEQQTTVSEPVNPYQLKTNIDPKWILLAIAIVGILSAILFTLRSKNA